MRPFGVGARGDHVRDLQRRLTSAGFDPGAIDGRYGTRTSQAVSKFQTARGLDVDGICDANDGCVDGDDLAFLASVWNCARRGRVCE